MSLVSKKQQGEYEKIPAGNYQAVCLGVFGLGYQSVTFQGVSSVKDQVKFVWEINKRDSKNARFIISKTYTNNLADKATLRSHLRSWLGRELTDVELHNGIDLEKFVGKNCFLNIVRTKDDKYSVIETITALPEGIPELQPSQSIPEAMMKKIEETKAKAITTIPQVETDVPF